MRLKQVKDAETLAVKVRAVWQLGEDPIPNLTELLEEHSIKVCIADLPSGVSGMTCIVKRSGELREVPVIVVNQMHTLERRRLTLAHELGHRLIHKDSPVDHEKAANYFAGALLIPEAHLKKEIGKQRQGLGYYELIELKQMYRVSAAAFLVRLERLGIIDASTLAYAFRSFARGWRREEPEALEEADQPGTQEPARRFERLCYRALAEKLISSGKASELLKCPLQHIERAMKGPAGGNAHHYQ